jgi:hypothetical protein
VGFVDKILWNERDPIGVNDVKTVRNEYQCYVPTIYNLKINKAKKKELANCLYKIETDDMGLPGNFAKCMKIAVKIYSI